MSLVLAFLGNAAYATGIFELVMGELRRSSVGVSQPVGVTNRSKSVIEKIEVECGFFQGKKLLGADSTTIENIEPGEIGFAEAVSLAVSNADRTVCRIVKG